MDIKKLCDRLIKDEKLNDIPLTYVFRIVFSIFDLIGTGEVFYE